mgnify:CR=1 FL=1
MKIAFSGTHGVSKTTKVYELASVYKKLHPGKSVAVLTDISKYCPYEVNKDTTFKSQMWILNNMMDMENYLLDYNDILITDRTVMDCLAYTRKAGMKELSEILLNYCLNHMKTYDRIYFIRRSNVIPLVSEKSGRLDDVKFQEEIENILLELYNKVNLENFVLV